MKNGITHLYGTWLAFRASSPRADITFPRANKPQLMLKIIGQHLVHNSLLLTNKPDSLLGPVSCCPGPLEPLRPGEVDEVELGGERLVVVVVGRLLHVVHKWWWVNIIAFYYLHVVQPLRVRTEGVLSAALSLLLHIQCEDGVRTGGLVVHVC